MSKSLTQAINDMRNMRESYDQIGAAAEAYNTGKTELAANITAKGVPASASETLPELAEKVSAIAQDSYTIDGGKLYSNTMYGNSLYNLFDVATHIYNHYTYANGGEFRGFILAQYYKGYDTIALSGSDSYLTCDGDLYNGSTTHTWHDDNTGKSDRWVAYMFRNDNFSFTSVADGLCPRQIVVVGKCQGMTIDYNRLTNLYVMTNLGGELGGVLFNSNTPEGQWSPVQIISGIEVWSANTLFKRANSGNASYPLPINFVEFQGLKQISGGILMQAYFNNLQAISFPDLEEVSGGAFILEGGYLNLNTISFPKLEEINYGLLIHTGITPKLKKLSFPVLRRITSTTNKHFGVIGTTNNGGQYLEVIELPQLEEITDYGAVICGTDGGDNSNAIVNMQSLSLPKLKTIARNSFVLGCGGNSGMAMTSMSFPELEKIIGGSAVLYTSYQNNTAFPVLSSLTFPKLKEISGGSHVLYTYGNDSACFASLTFLSFPVLEECNNITQHCRLIALEHVYLGYEENDRTKTVCVPVHLCPALTDIEIKDGYCKNLVVSNATTLTETNIVSHILNRLGTNQAYLDNPIDANKLTITLGSTNLAKLTTEEKQIAIDKGFTLA